MIDTHAHINFNHYKNDLEEVLLNAEKNGVNKIFVIGTDLASSIEAVRLSNTYKNLYATVGVHPGYVDEFSDHNKLNELYKNNKVIAVGEIGLDFYRRDDNKQLQIKVFKEQLDKALNLNLPVIIHTRNSFDETYEILKDYKGKLKGVLHCFSSTLEDAYKTIDLGFLIGIDGPITFKNNNEELIKIVENIDLKDILIETDSPYLTPVPYRGKRNEPAHVKYVAKKIADIKNITLDEVIETTTNNAIKLFNIEV